MPTQPARPVDGLLRDLGVVVPQRRGPALAVRCPIDGDLLTEVPVHTPAEARACVERAHRRFDGWRSVPAPRRGQLVRRLAELCRERREALARLVTLETGKLLAEARGEIQEVVDICEFAVGLSRQLHGLTIASERPDHKLLETWHPMGVCAVVTAFNFPAAVWAWNAAIALVCGNTVVWKPSEKTPLTALAMHALLGEAAAAVGFAADGLNEVVLGGSDLGELLVDAREVTLVSATGSTRMGRSVGRACAGHFKRCILELGGNNAAIVMPSADLELTVRAITFAAVGTAGQRCTTLRRLFVHASVHDALVRRLVGVYGRLVVGDPFDGGTQVGPLIDDAAAASMARALAAARRHGGVVHHGQALVPGAGLAGAYLRPALVEMPAQVGPMLDETFAPILYVTRVDGLEEAIRLNNAVAHGLSSSLFTTDLREAEVFTSAVGSDCGIANVNIGTSGAEIGGAFGGNKETGGGREAGSDAWKSYMRRATNTVHYGRAPQLAQGVSFDV